jgi:hypothetical protein
MEAIRSSETAVLTRFCEKWTDPQMYLSQYAVNRDELTLTYPPLQQVPLSFTGKSPFRLAAVRLWVSITRSRVSRILDPTVALGRGGGGQLRKTFGSKEKKERGHWRQLREEEFHNLYL